jgi:precorrin-2 dehydrogenase / sirohydrochlorin ferrochelatase
VSGVPILVEGSAIQVLIVGGGAVASRKAAVLLEAGAHVRIVAPVVGDAMRAIVNAGRVELVHRRYEPGDIGDAQLVVAATDDRAVNAAVASDARAAGRLVNVADRPADGSFATMAMHRAGSLVIGVSAGGVPGAAARIRDAIAARFDSRYSRALAELTSVRRALLDRGDGATLRERSAELLGDGFCEAVEQGTVEQKAAAWR